MYLVPVSKQIDTIIVGPFEVNCYLVFDPGTKDLVIIDPGDEPEAIARRIGILGGTPKAILLTHGHGDHIGGVTSLLEKFPVPLIAGTQEAQYLADPQFNLSGHFGPAITIRPADRWVADEEMVECGSIRFRVLATSGHTTGGISFLDEEEGVLFCGDTLFQGSIGRTDFPGSSFNQLMKSIQQKILTLPDEIVCYPGHGPKTTVGAERRSNPFLLEYLYG
ncbi:MAG: MBL fold metallo-hydrolase [candidate division Zixibacteria bacterium]|nr:MBL fold metallo-hydrolase [candidate division Zixibacteria bacterium]